MILGLLAILLAAGVLYVIVSGAAKKPRTRLRHSGPTLNEGEIRERWERIEQASQQGEHGLRNAISDADKLLDQVLKQRGFGGETMAERLGNAESRFSNKEDIWQAHKIRNAIAHEVSYDLVMTRGQKALQDFHRGLVDLGAL